MLEEKGKWFVNLENSVSTTDELYAREVLGPKDLRVFLFTPQLSLKEAKIKQRSPLIR